MLKLLKTELSQVAWDAGVRGGGGPSQDSGLSRRSQVGATERAPHCSLRSPVIWPKGLFIWCHLCSADLESSSLPSRHSQGPPGLSPLCDSSGRGHHGHPWTCSCVHEGFRFSGIHTWKRNSEFHSVRDPPSYVLTQLSHFTGFLTWLPQTEETADFHGNKGFPPLKSISCAKCHARVFYNFWFNFANNSIMQKASPSYRRNSNPKPTPKPTNW